VVGDLVVGDLVARDLVVRDLVVGGVHALLEGGIVDGAPVPTLDSWKAALEELPGFADDDAMIYAERGTPVAVADGVPTQQL